jgi:hypothetical protein
LFLGPIPGKPPVQASSSGERIRLHLPLVEPNVEVVRGCARTHRERLPRRVGIKICIAKIEIWPLVRGDEREKI